MLSSTSAHEERRQVCFLMMEFPAGTPPFNGDMAAELMRLHDVGLIRVLDLLVILKDSDGGVRGCEATGLDGPDMRSLGSDLSRVLAAEDVSTLAEALEPGTTAGVVVWDNTWVAPLVDAARRAGGEPVAAGSIPSAALIDMPPDQTGRGTDPGASGGRQTWEPLHPRRHESPGLLEAVERSADVPRHPPDPWSSHGSWDADSGGRST